MHLVKFICFIIVSIIVIISQLFVKSHNITGGSNMQKRKPKKRLAYDLSDIANQVITIKTHLNIDDYQLPPNDDMGIEIKTEIIEKTSDTLKYKFILPEKIDNEFFATYPIIRPGYIAFFAKSVLMVHPDDSNNINFIYPDNFKHIVYNFDRITADNLEEVYFVMTNDINRKISNTKISNTKISNTKIIYTEMPGSYMPVKNMSKIVTQTLDKYAEYFGHAPDRYLFNYIGVKTDDRDGHGGHGITNGFVLSVTDCPHKGLNDKIITLIRHEILHHYIKFRGWADTWYSEGFTEFLCRKLFLSPKKFAEEVDEFAKKYKANPNIKELITKESFWGSEEQRRAPYVRGFMIANEMYNKDPDAFKSFVIGAYLDPNLDVKYLANMIIEN